LLFKYKKFKIFILGVVHKIRPQSRGKVFIQSRHFADKGRRGSSDADVRTFWCKELRVFRNLWWVPTRTRGMGLSQCGNLADKGVNFLQFCADVDGPLKLSNIKNCCTNFADRKAP